MKKLPDSQFDYQRVAKAIEFLKANQLSPPSLEDTAQHLHLSPEHFQKLFTRWAGVSPKQFSQYLTKEYATQCLREFNLSNQTIALKSGLSGSGRLHDLMVKTYGMTPGEYAQQGKNLTIDFGFHTSPFGDCLIASTEKGICKLAFFDSEHEKQALLTDLKSEWSLSRIIQNQNVTERLLPAIFNSKTSEIKSFDKKKSPTLLRVLLKGTHFQLQVWEALLTIPEGKLCAYSDVAEHLGKENATRAVSSAIAKNNIAVLIPCHRVIRQNGEFNQYRWGSTRKQAIIGWEASQSFQSQVE